MFELLFCSVCGFMLSVIIGMIFLAFGLCFWCSGLNCCFVLFCGVEVML